MSAIIMIEIVIGLVVLIAAVRFAVRDARERGGFSVQQQLDSMAVAEAPEHAATAAPEHAAAPEPAAEPQTQEHMSEVGTAEKS